MANWDGGRWSKPIEVDPPPGHHGGPPIFGPFIYSVACWTARSCAVVDAWGHALTWDGSRWSQREELGVSFDAISCAGEEDCMALSTGGTAFIWDGVRWSEQAALPVRTATHSTVSCVTSRVLRGGRRERGDHLGRHELDPAQEPWSGPRPCRGFLPGCRPLHCRNHQW